MGNDEHHRLLKQRIAEEEAKLEAYIAAQGRAEQAKRERDEEEFDEQNGEKQGGKW